MPSYKISHEEVMYSMVTMVNNIVLNIWKFLTEWILKALITHTSTVCKYRKWNWKLLSCVRLFVTQGLYSSWGSPGQNTSGWPFPSPGALPNSGMEPRSLTLQADSLLFEPPEESQRNEDDSQKLQFCFFSFFADTRVWAEKLCPFAVPGPSAPHVLLPRAPP